MVQERRPRNAKLQLGFIKKGAIVAKD